MAHRPAKIKRMSVQINAVTGKDKSKTVGDNTVGNANAQIAAKGALTVAASGVLNTAIGTNTNAHNAAISATGVMHTKTGLAAAAYNNLASIVEVEDPNNPDNWIAFGFEVTETDISKLPVPEQVINGSVSNGDHLGTADVHHDPAKNADNYTHRVSKDDPTDDTKYIQITSPMVQYTRSSCTVNLPTTYLYVPLFWKTTAHNTAGAGPESDPYGGGRING